MSSELTILERLLACHDWHYEYSDDHSVWNRGRRERDAINTEQKRLITNELATADEIIALTDKYRPKNG
jgi:hypothetical protein